MKDAKHYIFEDLTDEEAIAGGKVVARINLHRHEQPCDCKRCKDSREFLKIMEEYETLGVSDVR